MICNPLRYPKRGTKGYNYMNKGKRGKKKQTNWEGLEGDPENHFGFIYKVTHKETGKYYLGKKQYWKLRPKAKRKHKTPNTKLESLHFHANFIESDWKTYTTSARNKEFKKYISSNPNSYVWEILINCKSKAIMSFMETVCILKQSTFLTDDGCYNGHVDKIYKPTEEIKDMVKQYVRCN